MTALLEVRQLQAFYSASQVLHGVNLRVMPGEVVCLLGRNGSGRTTLLRAIMGLVESSGAVVWRGLVRGAKKNDITSAQEYFNEAWRRALAPRS